ncbi:LegC family aminotransferase [Anaeromusa acidaminophila]|uniref:LegC family aminotransferase n=1 Tax=Anaeromusa acidaminophila TaxID=81464 RepID=UPI00036D4B03|nr:LegC family aminotransferase [Anaeromusa acidaminophila]
MKKGQVDISQLLGVLKSILPKEKGFIPLHEPNFAGAEWSYVKECLDTGWVSSVGKFVDLFEEKLAEYTGVKRAVAVVNGTAALHISLLAAGVEQNEEVLMPALTFIATANAVSYCGAVPHFVDSEYNTLGVDAKKLRDYLQKIALLKNDVCYNRQSGRRIRAVVPMHTFGHPVDLDELLAVCEEFKLVLVEDAAESLGSFYKGKHTGNWGLVSAVSFNGNKIATTGGGGAVLTNDEELGEKIKHWTTQAKVPHRWEFQHDAIGYNYRLPNINAALGCAQLEQLPAFVEAKRKLADTYRQAFAGVEGISFFVEPSFAQSNYWLNAILLDADLAAERDTVLAALNDAGIMGRPVWNLMYTLPMFRTCPRMTCEVADDISKRLINIPSSANLHHE